MNNWYEREEQILCNQLNNGEITEAEFQAAIREMNAELRMQADEAAEQAREDFYSW